MPDAKPGGQLAGPACEAKLDAARLQGVQQLGVDPAKIEAARDRWKSRAERKVRVRPLSPITIARARPHVLAELAHIAAEPPWAGVPAPK